MNSGFSQQWTRWRQRVDLEAYDRRFEERAEAGENIHGEADLVSRLCVPSAGPLLDAGCGTGRIAVELSRRGFEVVGVDNDPDMLAIARPKSDVISWIESDLATIRLERQFANIVMAGNIPVYVRPESRRQVVTVLVEHLLPGGLLICGSGSDATFTPPLFRQWCEEAGLAVQDQYATWSGEPYDGGAYAVIVAAKPE